MPRLERRRATRTLSSSHSWGIWRPKRPKALNAPWAAPTNRRMRQLAHKAIGVFFWLLMGALWVLLWRDGRASWSAFEGTGVRLAILAGTVFAITTWWVRHNVGIYRRKGPRSGRPENLPKTDVDRLGRTTRWSLPGGHVAARDVPHLIVELDGDVKRYRRAGSR